MSKAPVEFWTPVGRIVSGDVFNPRTTDGDGNALVVKNGPNAGQLRVEYYFALAIRKDDPQLGAFYQTLVGEARTSFPHLFDAGGNCIHPSFSWKMTDGDSQVPNKKLKKPCDNEGWPGCFVFHFSTSLAPKCYDRNKAVAGAELTDPSAIKRGYFVQVNGTVAGNGRTDSPGIYLNPRFVLKVAYGEEIVSGPDVATAMTTAPAITTLPPGATTVPPAMSAAPALPGAPAAPSTPVSTPALPVTPAAPVAAPGMAPPPDHSILTPPAAAPGKQLTAKAGGATYQQYIDKGWTDALLIQHGFMLP